MESFLLNSHGKACNIQAVALLTPDTESDEGNTEQMTGKWMFSVVCHCVEGPQLNSNEEEKINAHTCKYYCGKKLIFWPTLIVKAENNELRQLK